MKLALVSPDGVAACMLCSWSWKVPHKMRGKLRAAKELTTDEKLEILEEQVLSHLRYVHDRLLLTKDTIQTGGEMPRVVYNGRRPSRSVK